MRAYPHLWPIHTYVWCSMIAPIDGSDPPEPPPTPVTFDSRIRSIRAKSTRGWRPGYAIPDIWRCFARCSYMVRQRQGLGHEWNAPWPWMEWGHGHKWNASWPRMEWGHAWGPCWWRILNLGILTSQKHSQERAGFSGALTGTNSARESGHSITPLNQA